MNQQAIETQIKAISGNAPVLEKLYELLDGEDAIALVGAGVSAGLWPLWDEFLKSFVDHSLKLGKVTPPEEDYFKKEVAHNPLETAQQLRKTFWMHRINGGKLWHPETFGVMGMLQQLGVLPASFK